MSNPNPKPDRLARWLRAEKIIRSETCSVCKRRTGVRLDEEIGYICKACMVYGKRCSCGSGLPLVREIGVCRSCYIVEEYDPRDRDPRRSSAISRAAELVDGPGFGPGEGAIQTFKEKLSASMKREGIGFDSQEDAVRSCFVFGGLSGQRRRAGMLSLGDRDE